MAATPASSVEDQTQNNQEQITFRFCREWYIHHESQITKFLLTPDFSSNMLYPKEDLNNRKLMYACRTCQFSEEASSSCVFRNNLYNTVGETAGVTQDVGSDPTVGLPDFCTLCGQRITCPLCQETLSGADSLCKDLLEDIMLWEDDSIEMDEEEYKDHGDEMEDEPVQQQAQLEALHA